MKIENWRTEFWGSKKRKTMLVKKINSREEETLFIGAPFCSDLRESTTSSVKPLISDKII
ncbi:MAG: hypothetical protein KJO86_07815 [Muriicola sp.]|nr:hypothetical protein [Muriicola sp.]